jgi:hypothetical protein
MKHMLIICVAGGLGAPGLSSKTRKKRKLATVYMYHMMAINGCSSSHYRLHIALPLIAPTFMFILQI